MSADAGALLEVELNAALAHELLAAWTSAARGLTEALGWGDALLQTRAAPGMALLFIGAPVDQLMTATDVNEAAWVIAEGGAALPLAELKARAMRERAPNLRALYRTAVRRRVSFSLDDASVSVGSGAGARSWPRTAVPEPDSISWTAIAEVPIALVTGSNGKTTTARLVSAMLRAHGHRVGTSTTDGVVVDGELVAAGDYSGPAGARLAAHDPRVTAAVLESARGGLLRRGLGLSRADVAIITNVTADHFGEYGIHDLASLADAKLIVARALDSRGTLVLNADDAELRRKAAAVSVPIAWFSLHADDPFVQAHIEAGGTAAVLRDERLLLHDHGVETLLGAVRNVPITFDGTAPYNIANALGAAVVAHRLGVPSAAISSALLHFGSDSCDNEGRLDRRSINGATLLIDYAHNPAGLAALCAVAARMPARRRLLVLGQAGNRDDAALRALARTAWSGGSWDRVLIKGMTSLHRGRAAGEVEQVLVRALLDAGAAPSQVEVVPSELEAVQRAVEWAAPGDLLVVPVHAERSNVLRWLERRTS